QSQSQTGFVTRWPAKRHNPVVANMTIEEAIQVIRDKDARLEKKVWLSWWTRVAGAFDFAENLCLDHGLEIGPTRAEGEWPHIRQGVPVYSGFAIIAESEDC